MKTFNIVMCILMALTIIAGGVFAENFLALSYGVRLTIGIAIAAVFGTWIFFANVRDGDA